MKKTGIALIALLGWTTAQAQDTIEYANSRYAIQRMGRVIKVVAQDFSAAAVSDSNIANLGCEKLQAEIEKQKPVFEICQGHPTAAICSILKKNLRLISEGRGDSSSPIDPRFSTKWSAKVTNADEVAELSRIVARRYQASENQVSVVSTGAAFANARGVTARELNLGTNSITAQVKDLLELNYQGLISATNDGSGIVTRNRFLSCDLAKGEAEITFAATGTWAEVERVPTEVMQKIWSIYENLNQTAPQGDANADPVVAAAEIGFHIGVAAVSETQITDKLLTPSALFTRLYSRDSGNPVLKEAAGPESLRRLAYPDQTHNLNLNLSWRLK